MTKPIDLVTKFYRLAEDFCSDLKKYEDVLLPQAKFHEFPNLINRDGQDRDLHAAMAGMQRGRALLAKQNFKITNQVEGKSQVVVEAVWTGVVGVDVGPLRRNQELKAFLCAIFEFKDGKISKVKNYDCYVPFV